MPKKKSDTTTAKAVIKIPDTLDETDNTLALPPDSENKPEKAETSEVEIPVNETAVPDVPSDSGEDEVEEKSAPLLEEADEPAMEETVSPLAESEEVTSTTLAAEETPPDILLPENNAAASSDVLAEEGAAAAPADMVPKAPPKASEPKKAPARKKTIYDLKLNSLDKDLSEEERREWSAIYASYRSKSLLTGTVIGSDQNTFDVRDRETGKVETKTLSSLIIIDYRVKVLIPESEMWMPGEERPSYALRNMTGCVIDYVIMEVDREGGCAIGSRRMALAAKRHFFATVRGGHTEGDLLKCRVLTTGPHRCTVECNGYDIPLSQRELSYTTIPDLRVKYHPGQELSCRLKSYDREAGRLFISVKEVNPNPFIDADRRHPAGSRRQAVISGKYAGGVFCTLPDDTVCLCLYSARHSDMDFAIGDTVILVIRLYDYDKKLIFGRILARWK